MSPQKLMPHSTTESGGAVKKTRMEGERVSKKNLCRKEKRWVLRCGVLWKMMHSNCAETRKELKKQSSV